MSVALRFNIRELQRFDRVMDRLSNLNRRQLAEDLGSELENQTRRRITTEKYAPDGTQWVGWTADYAATRHGGHSLLEGEGDLVDSIQFLVAGDANSIEVGSNLVYAAVHNFGSAEDDANDIPARQYLGLSAENAADLEDLVIGYYEETLQ